MEGTESGKVLRPGLAQLHILAHDADDVSLLLDGMGKIAGVSHLGIAYRRVGKGLGDIVGLGSYVVAEKL